MERKENNQGVAKALCALGLMFLACSGTNAVSTTAEQSFPGQLQAGPVEPARKPVIVGTGDSYSRIAAECAPELTYADLERMNAGKPLVAGDVVHVPATSACTPIYEFIDQLRRSCSVSPVTVQFGDNPDLIAHRAGMDTGAFGALNGITSLTSLRQGEVVDVVSGCTGVNPHDVR